MCKIYNQTKRFKTIPANFKTFMHSYFFSGKYIDIPTVQISNFVVSTKAVVVTAKL